MNGWLQNIFCLQMKGEFQKTGVRQISEFYPQPEVLIIHIDHGIEDIEISRMDQT
jgi:hypothetical protein